MKMTIIQFCEWNVHDKRKRSILVFKWPAASINIDNNNIIFFYVLLWCFHEKYIFAHYSHCANTIVNPHPCIRCDSVCHLRLHIDVAAFFKVNKEKEEGRQDRNGNESWGRSGSEKVNKVCIKLTDVCGCGDCPNRLTFYSYFVQVLDFDVDVIVPASSFNCLEWNFLLWNN